MQMVLDEVQANLAGEEQNLRAVRFLAQLFDTVEPRHARHIEIEKQHVECTGLGSLQGIFKVGNSFRFVPTTG